MKRILFFILLIISFAADAQVKQNMGTYGIRSRRIQPDSAFRIPTVQVGIKDAYAGFDTAQIYYRKSDSSLLTYTGSQWILARGAAGAGSSYTAGDGLNLTGSEFKVLTKRSITIDNDSVMLVNDSTATAPFHLYGFNIAGRRGFYRPDTTFISGFSTMVRPLISLTTTGSSGAATYNSATGVFNIPQYSGGGSAKAYPNLFVSNDTIYQRFNVLHYGADPTGATNSTTAFSACIAAIIAAGNGVMYIPNGYYLGKIVIPAVALPTLPTIKIEGESPPTPLFGTIGSYTLSNTAGAIIHDTSTSAGAVIQVAGSSLNNVYLEIENLDVRSYDNPYISGVDAYWAYGLKITNSTINTGVYNVLTDTPSHSTIGVRTPAINNAGWTILRDVVVTGYYTGFEINEHTDGENLVAASCERGMDFKTANLSSRFGRVNLMLCNYSLYVSGAHKFVIAEMNVEHQSGWYTTVRDIEDGSNLGVANIWYTTPNTFTVNGASGIKYHAVGVDYNLNLVTSIGNYSDANISIGDPASGAYALQLRKYDANRTSIPGSYTLNVNSVSGENSAEHAMVAGNGVVEGRLTTQYGAGATTPYNVGSGVLVGSRTSHPLYFYTKGTNKWWIDTLGNLLPFAHNSYDIGSTAAYVKDYYTSGRILMLGSSSGTAIIQPPAAAGTPTLTLPTTTSTLVGDVVTQTLTNKRWTARVGSTTSSATPTINTDNVDIYKLTAQAADITSMTTNLSGTPVDGDILEIQITGTAARAITWGASFVSTTVTLPATTTTTVTLTVILQYYTTSSYGNNKWHCVNYY